MKTDTIQAWQVDEGDLITLGRDDSVFTVVSKNDTGDSLSFNLRDEDGETEEFSFTPEEDIALVVSLEEEDE